MKTFRYLDQIQACLGLFLGLSILTVVIRLAIRIKTRHRLYSDNAVLIFSLIYMSVATGLVYSIVPVEYLIQAVSDDPIRYTTLAENYTSEIAQASTIMTVFILFFIDSGILG